jgi:hypothetical protein
VSLSPGGTVLVVNGISTTISPATITPEPLIIDGQTFDALPGHSSPSYVISGQTLTEGGVITFTAGGGAETVSLSPDGTVVVVNGVTSTVSSTSSTTPGPITIDGQVITASNGHSGMEYIISGQTLTDGGIITINNGGANPETISLSSNGEVVVINGVTSTISPAATITAAPAITVDGQIITPAGGSGTTYLVSGKVLTPGGFIVFNGPNGVETVSLSPDGSTLVEDVSGASTTSTLPTAYGIAQTAAPIITIGDETFTALPGPGPSYLLPGGKTLYPGGPDLTETIDGSVYIVSLSPSATVLIVEDVGNGGVVTRTEFETLFPATITRGRGTSTITTAVSGAFGAETTTQTSGPGATQTTNNPASLQGGAVSDRKIGGSLVVGIVGVALFAILL